ATRDEEHRIGREPRDGVLELGGRRNRPLDGLERLPEPGGGVWRELGVLGRSEPDVAQPRLDSRPRVLGFGELRVEEARIVGEEPNRADCLGACFLPPEWKRDHGYATALDEPFGQPDAVDPLGLRGEDELDTLLLKREEDARDVRENAPWRDYEQAATFGARRGHGTASVAGSP